jgi:putative flippase GtrA
MAGGIPRTPNFRGRVPAKGPAPGFFCLATKFAEVGLAPGGAARHGAAALDRQRMDAGWIVAEGWIETAEARLLDIAAAQLGPARARLLGELLRFGIVGGIGFVVDSGVLLLGLAAGLGPWFGRAVSYLAAASSTYTLNRAWTFRHAEKRERLRQWALFVVVNLVGFAFNYGTYAILILTVPMVAAQPVLGVAAGAVAGMTGNFLLSRRIVFGLGKPAG